MEQYIPAVVLDTCGDPMQHIPKIKYNKANHDICIAKIALINNLTSIVQTKYVAESEPFLLILIDVQEEGQSYDYEFTQTDLYQQVYNVWLQIERDTCLNFLDEFCKLVFVNDTVITNVKHDGLIVEKNRYGNIHYRFGQNIFSIQNGEYYFSPRDKKLVNKVIVELLFDISDNENVGSMIKLYCLHKIHGVTNDEFLFPEYDASELMSVSLLNEYCEKTRNIPGAPPYSKVEDAYEYFL